MKTKELVEYLCRVLEASGSIPVLVDIERYGICCIRS